MSDSKPLAQAGETVPQNPQGTTPQGTSPWADAASAQQAGGVYGQGAPAYGPPAYAPYGPTGNPVGGPVGNPGVYGPAGYPGCPSPAHFMFHQQFGPYAPHPPFGPAPFGSMPSFGPVPPPNAPKAPDTAQQAGYQWPGYAQNNGQGFAQNVAQNPEQAQAPGYGQNGPIPYCFVPGTPYGQQSSGAFQGAPGFGNAFAGGASFGPAGFGPAGPESFGPNAGGAAPNPFGGPYQANPGHEQSQDYFMGMCADIMEGKTDPSKFFGLLSGTGNLFWKGAIMGALLTFALNNESVKSALGESFSAIFNTTTSNPDTPK